MSIATQLEALAGYLDSAYDKIFEKNGTIPEHRNMQNLTNAIDSIAGGTIVPPEYGTLTGIALESLPNKLTYLEGENFNPQGCVVIGTYSGGYAIDVTGNCTFIVPTPLLYNTTSVTVSLETFTLTIPITVESVPVPAPASSMLLYHFNDNLVNEVTQETTSGSASYVQGKFGKAMLGKPGGENNVFLPTNIVNSNFTNQNYTFECWVKSDSPSIGGIGILASSNSSDFYYLLAQTTDITQNGVIPSTGSRGFFSDYTIDSIPSSFLGTVWNHIAITFFNRKYEIFLNGVKVTHGNIGNIDMKSLRLTNQFNYTYFDEVLFTNNRKYVDTFIPNHAPYYIPSND